MKPNKPVKKYALGFRINSNLNKSFNWVEFANPQTFDTEEEIKDYIEKNPNWNKHITRHPQCGIFCLSDEEVKNYNQW